MFQKHSADSKLCMTLEYRMKSIVTIREIVSFFIIRDAMTQIVVLLKIRSLIRDQYGVVFIWGQRAKGESAEK